MLLFERTTRALFLRLVSVGSPFLPTAYKALLSSLLGVLLELFIPSEEDTGGQGGEGRQPLHVFHHPYPYQLFAAVVAFGLTFRANLAYARYWEGRGSLASMGSKFADVALQVRMFSTSAEGRQDECRALDMEVTHLLSLLHALCIQTLRHDAIYKDAQNNLVPDDPDSVPPLDVTRGDFWHSLAPDYKEDALQTFYRAAKLPVIGGLRPEESDSLYGDQGNRAFSVDGYTTRGRQRLDTERSAKVMEAIGRIVADSAKSGLLDAPAPIISRTFQVLSEGHERGYMFARKISSTPFPFPFAQAIELFTFVFAFSVPFLFSAWLDGAVPVAAFTFVTSWCYLAMNEVSRMLEEPFGGDANDLPLARMQYEFNRRIERSDYADKYGGDYLKRQHSSVRTTS